MTALGCHADSASLVILGFLGVGAMNGAVLLARTAVADMYPESRKARAISYVLFGALFGAALGPLVFRPLFAGKDLELDTLVVPWLACRRVCVVGIVLALAIRPDPRTIAFELERAGLAPGALGDEGACGTSSVRSCRRPGVPAAVIAARRELRGDGGRDEPDPDTSSCSRHRAQADVFTVISLHIVGMFGLVLVVGVLVDRSRAPSRRSSAGSLIMAVSTVMLAWAVVDPVHVGLALPARSRLERLVCRCLCRARHAREAGRARAPRRVHRSRRRADSPQLLALLGGLAYSEWGVVAIAVGATVAVIAPAIVLSLSRRPPAVAPEPAG